MSFRYFDARGEAMVEFGEGCYNPPFASRATRGICAKPMRKVWGGGINIFINQWQGCIQFSLLLYTQIYRSEHYISNIFWEQSPQTSILARSLAYNTNTVKTIFSSSLTATIPTPNTEKMCCKCMT